MVFNIRNLVAWGYGIFMIASGRLKKVKTKSLNGEVLLSVYFHNPSKKLFESCVKWFIRHGYSFISTEELLTIKEKNQPLPPASVIFTVDDGWMDNKHNILPIAEKYKIPVTIFISTQPVEKGEPYWWSYVAKAIAQKINLPSVMQMKGMKNEDRLTVIDQIKAKHVAQQREAMTIDDLISYQHSAYVKFGAHTVTHPILTQCNQDVSFFEIHESKNKLKHWLGYEINSFAYPNGNYTVREIDNLKKSGYKIAFTTKPEYITLQNIQSVFEIPRFDVLENVSFTENICRMTGIWFDKNKKP